MELVAGVEWILVRVSLRRLLHEGGLRVFTLVSSVKWSSFKKGCADNGGRGKFQSLKDENEEEDEDEGTGAIRGLLKIGRPK